MTATFRRLAVLALIVAGVACDDATPIDPSPPNTPASVTDFFTGTLTPGASAFYSFPTFLPGSARLMLASVTAGTGTSGAALSPTLTLGLGIPSGTDCATFTSVNATPGLVPQIDGYGIEAGTYCVRIADSGSLQGTSSFYVRMTYPNAPTVIPTPQKTEAFDTVLAVGGASSRTVNASQSGNVSITLQSLGSTASRVGLGFGVARFDGSCAFTRSLETGAGSNPHITIGVVAGQYCLRVFDVGTLTAATGFSVAISYP